MRRSRGGGQYGLSSFYWQPLFVFFFYPHFTKPTRFSSSAASPQICLLDIFLARYYFFFAWYLSQVGVSKVLSFYFTWHLSQVGVGQVLSFFLWLVSGPVRNDQVYSSGTAQSGQGVHFFFAWYLSQIGVGQEWSV